MGCCGNKKPNNMEYEVTYKDGRTERFPTLQGAIYAARSDTSTDPAGKRRAATHQAVKKL